MVLIKGNTARITGLIKDFNGAEVVSPTLVKFIVYTPGFFKLEEHTVTTKITGTNKYYYDYTPTSAGKYIIEYWAQIGSAQAVARTEISVARS